MLWGLSGALMSRAAVLNEALPLVTTALPRISVPSLNRTTPLAAEPLSGTAGTGDTVAVKVRSWP